MTKFNQVRSFVVILRMLKLLGKGTLQENVIDDEHSQFNTNFNFRKGFLR